MPPLQAITNLLTEVESKPHFLQLPHTYMFFDHLPSLSSIPEIELANLLLDWRTKFPNAFWLLLLSLAEQPSKAVAAAKAFLRRWDCWDADERACLDPLFVLAYKTLPRPLQNRVANRPAVQQALSLRPNVDFIERIPPAPPPSPLPNIETIAGIQARLLSHGFPCGPITGTWNERTQHALYLFQYECDHPNPGALDEQTQLWLDEQTSHIQ